MENVITIKGAGSGSGQTRSGQQRRRATGRNPFKAGSNRAKNFTKLSRAQATVNDPDKSPRAKSTARNLLRANSVGPRSTKSQIAAASRKNLKPASAGRPRRTQRG